MKSCASSLNFQSVPHIETFDTEKEANDKSFSIGCFGSHYHEEMKKWMSCEKHEIYIETLRFAGNVNVDTEEKELMKQVETDMEKLMKKSCEVLVASIQDCSDDGCFLIRDIKQAFKNKGCEIVE